MNSARAQPICVIIADDHPLFRQGVAASLAETDDIVVVGQAGDAAGAVRVARRHLPDVALLDVSMEGDGLQAARDIAIACPATRVVMLTVSDDPDDLLAALRAGAVGYVLKGVSAHELAGVVRHVHAGEQYVAPELAGALLREMTRPQSADPLDELTPRERDILDLAAVGLSNSEIAARVSLAESTVGSYMRSITAKLHVRTRVEAVLLAYRARHGERSAGG